MAWGALLARKLTPYYMRLITVMPSTIARCLGMTFSLLVLFIIDILICWLIAIGFDSPALNSAGFYIASLFASIAAFGFVFILQYGRYERSWASSAGQKELENIRQDAVTEGKENQDMRKE